MRNVVVSNPSSPSSRITHPGRKLRRLDTFYSLQKSVLPLMRQNLSVLAVNTKPVFFSKLLHKNFFSGAFAPKITTNSSAWEETDIMGFPPWHHLATAQTRFEDYERQPCGLITGFVVGNAWKSQDFSTVLHSSKSILRYIAVELLGPLWP